MTSEQPKTDGNQDPEYRRAWAVWAAAGYPWSGPEHDAVNRAYKDACARAGVTP